MNWSWLLPSIEGIPVLMYHRVWPGREDDLTITPEKLQAQWAFLRQEGYQPVSIQEFNRVSRSGNNPPGKKSILITFDDGYVNNYQYAYPLLKEMGWQATFFIVADTIDGTAKKETNEIEYKLDLDGLRQLDPATVQLAMHGYHHEHFSKLSLEEIKSAITTSVKIFNESGLPYCKALAYPYGSRPKDAATLALLKTWMSEIGIETAFRIGNQVSKVPAPDLFEIRRIDIKGTDSMADFRIKLTKGKLKPF